MEQHKKGIGKLLKEDAYRRQAAHRWDKHTRELSQLDVLTRCRKLNKLLEEGLLADDSSGSDPSQPAKAAAGKAGSLAAPSKSHTKPQTGSAQPDKFSISAKESAALLKLLDLVPLPEPELAGSSAAARLADAAQHSDTPPPAAAAAAEAAAVPASSGRDATRDSPATADAAAGSYSTTGRAAGDDQQLAPPAPDEMLDVIHLLNSRTDKSPPKQRPATVASSSSRDSDSKEQDCPQSGSAPAGQQRVRQPRLSQAEPDSNQCSQQQQQQQQEGALGSEGSPAASRPQTAGKESSSTSLTGSDSAASQSSGGSRLSSVREMQDAAWMGYFNFWHGSAVVTVQRYWRARQARRQFLQQREAAVVLQSLWRGHSVRTGPSNPLNQALQQRQEQYRQAQQQAQVRARRNAAALVLQRCIRVRQACRHLESLRQQQQEQEQEPYAVVPVSAAMEQGTTKAPNLQCQRRSVEEAQSDGVAPLELGLQQQDSRQHLEQQQQQQGTELGDNTAFHVAHSGNSSSSSSRRSSTGDHGLGPSSSSSSIGRRRSSASGSCEAAAAAADAGQCLGKLVIRSTADLRTAGQYSGSGQQPGPDMGVRSCRPVAAAWQRVEEVAGVEGSHKADLSLRAALAGSSYKEIRQAMEVVKRRKSNG